MSGVAVGWEGECSKEGDMSQGNLSQLLTLQRHAHKTHQTIQREGGRGRERLRGRGREGEKERERERETEGGGGGSD